MTIIKSKITLSDGSIITSGIVGDNSIMSCVFLESVNAGDDVEPGSCCAACVDLKIYIEDQLTISEGDELLYSVIDDAGDEKQIGYFICEKPERISANIIRVTAYDGMVKTEIEISEWLRSIQDDFPMTLFSLASRVCSKCGLVLGNTSIPGGDFSVNAFYADGLTGREILQWIAQVSGQFCKCTSAGKIRFSNYAVNDTVVIYPGGTAPAGYADHIPYQSGGLSYSDYTVKQVDGVRINQSASDVGVIYPESGLGENTYTLTGNPILATDTPERIMPVAERIFNTFRDSVPSYTPLTVQIPAGLLVRAGEIVHVLTADGADLTAVVMSVQMSASGSIISCSGHSSRSSASAVNANKNSLRNVKGKLLEIEASVDGLNVRAKDLEGAVAEIRFDVGGLSTTVSNLVTSITENYSTTAETQSMIAQSATEIKSEVSQTVTTVASQVAKDTVDTELGDYSTTTEVKTLIQQTADAITLTTISNGDATQLTFNSDGLTVMGAGFRIKKDESTETFSVDSDGNCTVTGFLKSVYNGITVMNVTVGNGHPYLDLRNSTGMRVFYAGVSTADGPLLQLRRGQSAESTDVSFAISTSITSGVSNLSMYGWDESGNRAAVFQVYNGSNGNPNMVLRDTGGKTMFWAYTNAVTNCGTVSLYNKSNIAIVTVGATSELDDLAGSVTLFSSSGLSVMRLYGSSGKGHITAYSGRLYNHSTLRQGMSQAPNYIEFGNEFNNYFAISAYSNSSGQGARLTTVGGEQTSYINIFPDRIALNSARIDLADTTLYYNGYHLEIRNTSIGWVLMAV